MKFRNLLLALTLATALACSGSEKPAPDPTSAGTPVPGQTTTPAPEATEELVTGSNGASNGTATTPGSGRGHPTVLGATIKGKPMNVKPGADRLFQNGPTEEEIRRFRARQQRKKAGRLTSGRGGHSQPVFDDHVERIPKG